MNPTTPIGRRVLLQAAGAFGVALVAPAASACEYFAPNLRITHPWTRATPHGAPFAVLCMTIDAVTKADRLIGVETPVCEAAEMAGPMPAGARAGIDIALAEGADTVLVDSGTHIRLIGLRHPLEVARTYPLRLLFERGGAVDASLNVDYTSFRFK